MIKKAIIPAAGYGTRSLPITKVVPKEMFPIGVKPAIQYVVEEALDSGIEQILIVISRSKHMIIDYFDRSIELESFLEMKNKSHLLDHNDIPDVQLHYVRQPYAKGLGDAIQLGEAFIGSEPFAVLLPDDLIVSKQTPGLKQMIDVYTNYKYSLIGLNTVNKEFLHNYGVVNGKKMENEIYDLFDIVEKPKENAPSNLAVIGRYIFNPTVFSFLKGLKPGVGGEIQLTDAIKAMMKEEKCYGKILEGSRYDIGNIHDYLKLNQLIIQNQNGTL